jgi:Rod binding domain-containing protein
MISRIDTAAAAQGTTTAADAKTRAAAEGFERQLVEMLAKQLVGTTKAFSSEDGEDGSAVAGFYQDMLPSTLADAVTASGGIGLSDHLERALVEEQS